MRLNPVTPAFEQDLRQDLPPACFRPVAPHYLDEPRGFYQGQAGLVLAPATVDEVALVVGRAGAARVGIVPYGGGTGLVGAQLMPAGPPAPLVLSLERMTRIRDVSTADNVMIAEAGALLADVQAAAKAAGRLFPLSLASEGSCRIGGNLSTNAGGVQVLRYGNARDLCLGLEAVLPDGTIWHGLRRLRKDNTGYDVRDLLIGAEGTLGIITAAALKLVPRPTRHLSAFAEIRDPATALALLETCQARLGGMVSAFELIDRAGFDFLRETMPQVRLPFASPGRWMLLLEVGVIGDAALAASLETELQSLLGDALDRGQISDVLIAQNEAQRQDFWAVRETIPEANRLVGAISSHDVSVPLGQLPQLIEAGEKLVRHLGDDLRINCFGHVGDGNLHYNVYPPKGGARADFAHLRGAIKDAVYGLVHDLGGSVSAEHGIGRLKRDDLLKYGDPGKLLAMRAIKAALDPAGIMNPGAVLGD